MWVLPGRLPTVPPGRSLDKYRTMIPVSSSSKYDGEYSSYEVLIRPPRFTGSCQPKSSCLFVRRETYRSVLPVSPYPPGRPDWKNSECPSAERFGLAVPLPTAFMTGVVLNASKLTGACQGASILARCETQISLRWGVLGPLTPPGRSDVMYRLRPSLEIAQ